MKHVILPACLFLLLCLSFSVVTGQKQVAENYGETSTDRALVSSHSLDNAPNIQTATDNSPSTYSTNQDLTERTALPDCAEELPAKMKLQFNGAPVLGAAAGLDLVVVTEVNAPNSEIRIVLPEGFSLSSGSLQWNGNLLMNVAVEMNVFIKAETLGIWRVEAVATSKPPGEYSQICSTQCYAQVGEKEAHVVGPTLENSAKIYAVNPDANEDLKQPISLLSSGTVSVYGYWYYRNENLFLMPARYARVELWNESASGDVLLATTSVQSNGYYEFNAVESDDDSLALYVKLFCQSLQYQIVRVCDPDLVVYWSQTDVRNVIGQSLNMGSWFVEGDQRRECWNIYDTIVEGYFWLLNKTGWNKSEVWVEYKESPMGSYCLGNGMVIYPGDGWIRGTVLHEYGHCINFEARGGSFPPSNRQENEHYPDTESDGGWALREGWAEFFPCAVDNNPIVMYGAYYGSLETTIYADGPFGHGDYGDWDGQNVEGAVAQVFWDIFDGESPYDHPIWDQEGYGDYISNQFDKLWNIFLNQGRYINDIFSFWRAWTPKDVRVWEIFRHARITEPRNVAVTNVAPLEEKAIVGETTQINITVENKGQTIENFNVTALANSLLIGSLENITLEPARTETFTFNWSTTSVTKGIYVISGQAIVFPEDLNTTDDLNVGGTIAILLSGQAGPGDVNADGVVDILDIVIVATQFRRPPPPIADLRADINIDGIVDLLDIVIVAAHFGEIC